MRKVKIVVFLSLILFLLSLTPGLNAQEDFTMLNEARELRTKREWDKALEKYELVKVKFPDSKYVDDAEFWSAYILEEQGKESEAFMAYEEMIKKHPDSPWVDDAKTHQIVLAEKFVKQGQANYTNFLVKKLESPNKNVKYQAALSLGKLGDKHAIPVLKEMSNNGDRDMRSMGNSLLQKLERPTRLKPQDRRQLRPTPTIPPETRTDKRGNIKKQPIVKPQRQRQIPSRKPTIKSTPKRQPKRSTPPKTSPPKKTGKFSQLLDKNFHEMQRYKIYNSLATKGSEWTEPELATYGLWHILPEDQFDEFKV